MERPARYDGSRLGADDSPSPPSLPLWFMVRRLGGSGETLEETPTFCLWSTLLGRRRRKGFAAFYSFFGSIASLIRIPHSELKSIIRPFIDYSFHNLKFVNAQSRFALKRYKICILTKFRKQLNKSNHVFEGMSSHELKNFLNNQR